MLHLDDWEHLEDLINDPIAKQNFIWGSPKSKNIDYKPILKTMPFIAAISATLGIRTLEFWTIEIACIFPK